MKPSNYKYETIWLLELTKLLEVVMILIVDVDVSTCGCTCQSQQGRLSGVSLFWNPTET